jgi:hypothetical protein
LVTFYHIKIVNKLLNLNFSSVDLSLSFGVTVMHFYFVFLRVYNHSLFLNINQNCEPKKLDLLIILF